jgi:hypothetical protein
MSGVTVPSEAELDQLLRKTFTCNFRRDYVNVNDFLLAERYLELKKEIDAFEIYDSDVWICGFPKTGTTWMSEISWLISHDLDYEGAKVEDYKRIRMLEFSMLFEKNSGTVFANDPYTLDSIGYCRSLNHPRTIKSHLPFSLLPQQIRNGTKKPKIIYTTRNPMDTCVSYYHQCTNYEGYTGTFDEFCKLFLFNKISYGPFHKHVMSFWDVKDKPNILFLTYEEMKKDLAGVLQKVAKLLGKTLSNEDSLKLQHHVSFESMKKNPAVNKESIMQDVKNAGGKLISPFIRVGKVGGYKSVMSPDLTSQFDYWMRKRFQGTGLNIFED